MNAVKLSCILVTTQVMSSLRQALRALPGGGHHKAANAGCEVVTVDPRGTSQTCPECGTVVAKTLVEREHRCDCGCSLDRDVAAAIVVHQRAFGFTPGAGVGSLIEPVAA